MTYEEALAFISETQKYGSVPGFEVETELLRRLGDPQGGLKFIHIAGTNGKGSILAFVSSALSEAGYRTGRYISPSVYDYREKIQVDAAFIPKEAVGRLLERISGVCREMTQEGFRHPTVFEIETAMAFLYFQETACDIVVMECGMEDGLDATNAVNNTLVSVFSHIGIDHTDSAGDSLEKTAEEMAGIIKQGASVVSAPQKAEAEAVLERVSGEKGASFYEIRREDISETRYYFEAQRFSYKDMKRIKTSLAGSWQVENAAVAIETMEALKKYGFEVPEEILRKGLSKTIWPARFMTLDRHPLFIADGAHNRDAADALKETLRLYFREKRKIFIVGVLRDKDYDYMMSELSPLAERVIAITPPDNALALGADELAAVIRRYNEQVETAEDLKDAVRKARAYAREEDLILAFGSLSYMGSLIREARMERNYR